MRIKLLKTIQHGAALIQRGTVIDIADDEGKAFVAAEHARETDEPLTTDEDAAEAAAEAIEASESAAKAERKAASENKANAKANDAADKQSK